MNILTIERDLSRLRSIREHRYLSEKQKDILDTLIDDIAAVFEAQLNSGVIEDGEQSGNE